MNTVFGYKLALPAIPVGALIWGAAELVALQWSRLRGAFNAERADATLRRG